MLRDTALFMPWTLYPHELVWPIQADTTYSMSSSIQPQDVVGTLIDEGVPPWLGLGPMLFVYTPTHTRTRITKLYSRQDKVNIKNIIYWGTLSSSDGGDHPRRTR